MKYIIVNVMDCELAVLFDEILQHVQVAQGFETQGIKVISAGQCAPVTGHVWGKSVSLKLNSRPEDSELIKKSVERRC